MMKLEWSPDALEDLDAIYDVIALDDEDAAWRFVDKIRTKAGSLLITPRMGIKIKELDDEAFRELHYKGYTIIYEIRDEAIRIHEVYNQRRIYIRTYHRD